MNARIRSTVPFAVLVLLCVASVTPIARSQSMGTTASSPPSPVAAIDAQCSAIQDAVMALKPVHVVYRSNNWNVVGDKDYTVMSQTKTSILFADVYKQGSNYAWVTSHTFDSHGNQRATQLCFRQSDGSLQRVRQATTVEGLSATAATEAYYSSDGNLLQKTTLFAANDPMIVKTVKSLPFYSELPQ